MKRVFSNIIVFSSVLCLLVTSAGNTFGFAWCAGDDGRTRVEQAAVNGCADRQGECHPLDSFEPTRISTPDNEHSSPCSDVLLGSDKVVVPKRTVKPLKLHMIDGVEFFTHNTFDNQPQQPIYVFSLQRVSEAILAHRTVVLLN